MSVCFYEYDHCDPDGFGLEEDRRDVRGRSDLPVMTDSTTYYYNPLTEDCTVRNGTLFPTWCTTTHRVLV